MRSVYASSSKMLYRYSARALLALVNRIIGSLPLQQSNICLILPLKEIASCALSVSQQRLFFSLIMSSILSAIALCPKMRCMSTLVKRVFGVMILCRLMPVILCIAWQQTSVLYLDVNSKVSSRSTSRCFIDPLSIADSKQAQLSSLSEEATLIVSVGYLEPRVPASQALSISTDRAFAS